MKITRRIERQELVLATLQDDGTVLTDVTQGCLILFVVGNACAELPFVDIQLKPDKVLRL